MMLNENQYKTIKESYDETVSSYRSGGNGYLVHLDAFIEKLIKAYYIYLNCDSKILNDSDFYKDYLYQNLLANETKLRKTIKEIRKKSNLIKHSLDEEYTLSRKNEYFEGTNDLIRLLEKDSSTFKIDFTFNLKELNHKGSRLSARLNNNESIVFDANVERIEKVRSYKKKYIVIKSNYVRSDYLMEIERLTVSSTKISYVFKTLFNLLNRSDVIEVSSKLKVSEFDNSELKLIHHYQVQLLVMFLQNPKTKRFTVTTQDTLKALVTSAYEDIEEKFNHYVNLLKDKNYLELPFIEVKSGKVHDNRILVFNELKNPIVRFTNEVATPPTFLISEKNLDFYCSTVNRESWEYFTELLFGHDHLKKGQFETIESVVNSTIDDITCAILPTGYGKSLIYQLLAFLSPKISVVISPTSILISDQLYQLAFNDELLFANRFENFKQTDDYSSNCLLIYVEAASLYYQNFRVLIEFLTDKDILYMTTIDEVHQVSVWSQNFDVNYLIVPNYLVNALKLKKLLFTTATAGRKVKADLVNKFHSHNIKFINPDFITRKFIEHHLFFVRTPYELLKKMVDFIQEHIGKDTEFDLYGKGKIVIISNKPSHMKKTYDYLSNFDEIKDLTLIFNGDEKSYEEFRENRKKILITTDEFNIGINIPDVNVLINLDYALSKEWYYQETGRLARSQNNGLVLNYIIRSEKFLSTRINVSKREDYDELRSEGYLDNLENFFSLENLSNQDTEMFQNIFEGINEHRVKNYVFMNVPISKLKPYNNAFHFAYIAKIIKSWVLVKISKESLRFKLDLYELTNIHSVLRSLKKYIAEYSVHDLIDKTYRIKSNSFQEAMINFVDWYYISKKYQYFESINNVLIMMENAIQKENQHAYIEEQLASLQMIKTMESDNKNLEKVTKNGSKPLENEEFMNNNSLTQQNHINKNDDILDSSMLNGMLTLEPESKKIKTNIEPNSTSSRFVKAITVQDLINFLTNFKEDFNHNDFVEYFNLNETIIYQYRHLIKASCENLIADKFSVFYMCFLAFFELLDNDNLNRTSQLINEIGYEMFVSIYHSLKILERDYTYIYQYDFILRLLGKYSLSKAIELAQYKKHTLSFLEMSVLFEQFRMGE